MSETRSANKEVENKLNQVVDEVNTFANDFFNGFNNLSLAIPIPWNRCDQSQIFDKGGGIPSPAIVRRFPLCFDSLSGSLLDPHYFSVKVMCNAELTKEEVEQALCKIKAAIRKVSFYGE
jgi:hypothetical protein